MAPGKITLDGIHGGPRPWDLDFHEYAWGDELDLFSLEQACEVDGLIFGRCTDSEQLRLQLLHSSALGDRCLLLRYQPAGVRASAA